MNPELGTIVRLRKDQAMDRRDEFLVVMYEKMWDNINRHLTVVWEAATIMAGAWSQVPRHWIGSRV